MKCIDGFRFPVNASDDCQDRARSVAALCQASFDFLAPVLDCRPGVVLWVLNETDWRRRASEHPFGLPHYTGGNLVVAGTASGLPNDLVNLTRQLVPDDDFRRIVGVYGNSPSQIDLSPFFDLLVVHELAHAFVDVQAHSFARHWLGELFPNLCLHAFVASSMPDRLPQLVTFPEIYSHIDPVPQQWYFTLKDFESRYGKLDGPNYAWYQTRLHVAARQVFDVSGLRAIRALWQMCVDADQLLLETLEHVAAHEVAEIATSWPG